MSATPAGNTVNSQCPSYPTVGGHSNGGSNSDAGSSRFVDGLRQHRPFDSPREGRTSPAEIGPADAPRRFMAARPLIRSGSRVKLYAARMNVPEGEEE